MPVFLAVVYGLSPRVRGNPVIRPTLTIVVGSIPACAGEPPCIIRLAVGEGVYPRVCVGTPVPAMPGTML